MRRREWGGWWTGRERESESDEGVARKKDEGGECDAGEEEEEKKKKEEQVCPFYLPGIKRYLKAFHLQREHLATRGHFSVDDKGRAIQEDSSSLINLIRGRKAVPPSLSSFLKKINNFVCLLTPV